MSSASHALPRRLTRVAIIATFPAVALLACGGGEKAADTTAAAAPATSSAVEMVPLPGPPPAGATAEMLAQGDSIFHGAKSGGLCITCHGPDAKGTVLAPNLTDTQWLTGDGSYDMIQKRVTDGMPNPTPPYTSPMLPKGGAQLSPDDIKAVAAYVWSISHRGS